jgi:hypothetical protein
MDAIDAVFSNISPSVFTEEYHRELVTLATATEQIHTNDIRSQFITNENAATTVEVCSPFVELIILTNFILKLASRSNSR